MIMKLIDKDILAAEIKKRVKGLNRLIDIGCNNKEEFRLEGRLIEGIKTYENILDYIDTLEVIDPYEQCVQYPSVKDGIEAHASIYSFNTESQLFPQLTKEQQALWRKEIEQACISGGDVGVTLARDQRYKENLKVKEVALEEELGNYIEHYRNRETGYSMFGIAKYFFELGLKVQKGNKL